MSFDFEDWEVDFPALEGSELVIEHSIKGGRRLSFNHPLSSVFKDSEAALKSQFRAAKEKTESNPSLAIEISQRSGGTKVLIARWENGKIVEYQHPPWRDQVF